MYQKSPFPYLFTLLGIVGISCFTNLTIDKEIDQPIIHEIKNTSSNSNLLGEENLNSEELYTKLAITE